MIHNPPNLRNPEATSVLSIIPLNGVVMLTTERVKRAQKLGVSELSIPIKYATFFAVCKAIRLDNMESGGNDWAYIEHTEEEIYTYARIWGLPITRLRVVIETIFTFKDDMPTTIEKWSDAIPYLHEDEYNGLKILDENLLYTIAPTLRRPYTDRDPSRRTRINTNNRGETILSHHVKQWASNWGRPHDNYMQDLSHYSCGVSAIDAAEFITKGILPTVSPKSKTRQDTFANSMAFSR